MLTPDRVRTQRATESLSFSGVTPIPPAQAQSLPRVRRDAPSVRTTCQNAPPSYPRIPRLVSRYAKSATPTLNSQFQVNASHVQKPLSLIVPSESPVKGNPVSAARHSLVSRSERPSDVESSSSSEKYESSGSIPTPSRQEKSRRRDGRASSSVDTDDEDPFHFDNILSPPPAQKKEESPSRTLSSSLLRRASIIPVDPTAEPAPHRFSLLRDRASEETIFVQEICDADGRRWSLRVPASGLPEDMVHMLEELEKLAVELGQALPRIVVTCSAESLSLKRMERNAIVNSSGLLRPPPAMDDGSLVGRDTSTGHPSVKEKRLVKPEQVLEEPERHSEPTPAAVSSASEQSLTCIYLPELAPEFLSGSSNSPVLQPADGFHSKPAHAIPCPRERAFFSALKDSQQPTSSIAKRLVPLSTKTETEAGVAAPQAKSKPRAKATKSKSALPILKANLKSPAAEDDRRRARLASLSESPPRQEGVGPPGQHHPSNAPNHVPHDNSNAATMSLPPGASVSAGASAILQQHPAITISSSSSLSQPPNRSGTVGANALRAVSAPAAPTGRRLRHLFRRPPVRSASDPPLYSYSARPVIDGVVKRPVSEVVPAPREVVERRMPRLPSARDLFRKLT